jgi:sugar transferase (PEP-CTERM/EpsH1 system associated)
MKLFIILPRFPYPLEKGDKLRAYNLIKHLSEQNDIILCSLNDNKKLKKENISALEPYCYKIKVFRLSYTGIIFNILKALFSGKPLQVGYFYNRKAHRNIKRLLKEHKPDHIFCQLLRTAEYARSENIKKTIDYQDVFSKGVERRIEKSGFLMKPILKMEYRRLLKYENQVFDDFNNKVIISKPDKVLIPHPDKDKIEVIPNGVDHEYFQPMDQEKEFDLLFTGNMGYPPNINGAEFLVKEILPILLKEKPDIKVVIAGANPHNRVKVLENKNVRITGWVEDMREYYAKTRIFIAPMQIGTGLQNKLLEAMAMKIPSVTSALANNALEAKPDVEILIGNTAIDYAKHIIRLLDDENFRQQISEKGYSYVSSRYNWENASKHLNDIMINS